MARATTTAKSPRGTNILVNSFMNELKRLAGPGQSRKLAARSALTKIREEISGFDWGDSISTRSGRWAGGRTAKSTRSGTAKLATSRTTRTTKGATRSKLKAGSTGRKRRTYTRRKSNEGTEAMPPAAQTGNSTMESRIH